MVGEGFTQFSSCCRAKTVIREIKPFQVVNGTQCLNKMLKTIKRGVSAKYIGFVKLKMLTWAIARQPSADERVAEKRKSRNKLQAAMILLTAIAPPLPLMLL